MRMSRPRLPFVRVSQADCGIGPTIEVSFRCTEQVWNEELQLIQPARVFPTLMVERQILTSFAFVIGPNSCLGPLRCSGQRRDLPPVERPLFEPCRKSHIEMRGNVRTRINLAVFVWFMSTSSSSRDV